MFALAAALSGCDREPSQLPRRSASERDLAEYRWQVQLATRADGTALALLQPDGRMRITVDFDSGHMDFSAGLNSLTTKYRIEGSRILGDGFELTMMGSPNERLIATDNALGHYLKPPFEQWLEGTGVTQRLYLPGADGTRLILQTLDAPYGAKGEHLMLELAPTKGECGRGPPSPHEYCLTLRKMRRDNAIAQPISDWFVVPEYAFDGYRFQPDKHRQLNVRYFPSLTKREGSPGVYVIDQNINFNLSPMDN